MTYKYSDHLESPDKFFAPNANKLDKNINNMTIFVDLLTKPKGKASKGETLGDRSFVKTIGQCTSTDGTPRDRYLWVNNEVTDGGLLSSTVDTLNELDVNLSTTTPDCKCVKGVTRDNSHATADVYRYIADSDFADAEKTGILEAADDSDCEPEPFGNLRSGNLRSADFPKDPLHKMYFTSITLLGGYILFLLYSKRI